GQGLRLRREDTRRWAGDTHCAVDEPSFDVVHVRLHEPGAAPHQVLLVVVETYFYFGAEPNRTTRFLESPPLRHGVRLRGGRGSAGAGHRELDGSHPPSCTICSVPL